MKGEGLRGERMATIKRFTEIEAKGMSTCCRKTCSVGGDQTDEGGL